MRLRVQKPAKVHVKNVTVSGRGQGSGNGKTAGRGQKVKKPVLAVAYV